MFLTVFCFVQGDWAALVETYSQTFRVIFELWKLILFFNICFKSTKQQLSPRFIFIFLVINNNLLFIYYFIFLQFPAAFPHQNKCVLMCSPITSATRYVIRRSSSLMVEIVIPIERSDVRHLVVLLCTITIYVTETVLVAR